MQRLGDTEDFSAAGRTLVRIGDREVAVFAVDGAWYAYENRCPHAGGPVCQGKIFRKVEEVLASDRKSLGLRFSATPQIVCPWHGFEYDIATGRHPGDSRFRLKRVEVTVRDGNIYVRTPA